MIKKELKLYINNKLEKINKALLKKTNSDIKEYLEGQKQELINIYNYFELYK